MRYLAALKLWNSHKHTCDTTHCYIAPRKGTKEHAEVAWIAKNNRIPADHEVAEIHRLHDAEKSKPAAAVPPKPHLTPKPAAPAHEQKSMSDLIQKRVAELKEQKRASEEAERRNTESMIAQRAAQEAAEKAARHAAIKEKVAEIKARKVIEQARLKEERESSEINKIIEEYETLKRQGMGLHAQGKLTEEIISNSMVKLGGSVMDLPSDILDSDIALQKNILTLPEKLETELTQLLKKPEAQKPAVAADARQAIYRRLLEATEEVPNSWKFALNMFLWKGVSYKEEIEPIILAHSHDGQTIFTFNEYLADYKSYLENFKDFENTHYVIKIKGKKVMSILFEGKKMYGAVNIEQAKKNKDLQWGDAEELKEAFTYTTGKPYNEKDSLMRVLGHIGGELEAEEPKKKAEVEEQTKKTEVEEDKVTTTKTSSNAAVPSSGGLLSYAEFKVLPYEERQRLIRLNRDYHKMAYQMYEDEAEAKASAARAEQKARNKEVLKTVKDTNAESAGAEVCPVCGKKFKNVELHYTKMHAKFKIVYEGGGETDYKVYKDDKLFIDFSDEGDDYGNTMVVDKTRENLLLFSSKRTKDKRAYIPEGLYSTAHKTERSWQKGEPQIGKKLFDKFVFVDES